MAEGVAVEAGLPLTGQGEVDGQIADGVGGRARRLAAGWVRKSPDGQLDVVRELLVQFLSGGGGRRRQPDRERRLLPSSTSGMGYCIKVPGC